MPSPRCIVVIGTGGTISATAASADENVAYRAGAVAVDSLATALSLPAGLRLESEQLAQVDSKDMGFDTWRALAFRVEHHLARTEVAGVVVTHGTDTMEETAWFLERVLAPAKPVVLTGAMRPASSRQADGPQNLADAVAHASQASEGGVAVVLAGTVHSARSVRKRHPYRLDAFSSGDAGPLGYMEAGRLRSVGRRPERSPAIGTAALPSEASTWPRVAIVTSGAGADAGALGALVEAGFDGIVIAATGNGTVHEAFDEALRQAHRRGVALMRATRCLDGAIVAPEQPHEAGASVAASAGDFTPQQARVELIVRLLAARESADSTAHARPAPP